MSSPAVNPSNTRWFAVALAFAAAATVISQAKLQTWGSESVRAEARKVGRYSVTQVVPAIRGRILDRTGKPLAEDSPITELNVTFADVPNSSGFWLALADAVGIPAAEFEAVRATEIKSRSWQVSLSPEQRRKFGEVRKFWRADGISLNGQGMRHVVIGDSGSPVVGGFRRQKINGKVEVVRTGLEGTQDTLLSGKPGKLVGFADEEGHILPNRIIETQSVDKQDGADIVTTIDADIQMAAYESLSREVATTHATEGSAVVIDPRTGDVLAMATYPTFPWDEKQAGNGVNFGANPATKTRLEPGSTFKILTLAKALDEGATTLQQKLTCNLTMRVRAETIGCDRSHGAHGTIDPVQAIAKSCNVSAANWALRIGHGKFDQFMNDLGLFQPTGIELGGETRGFRNTKEWAKDVQLATWGFGQSVTCTPLGLASAFSMIGNQGKRVPPRLIRRIGGKDQPIRPGSRVISEAASAEVLQAMEAVVETQGGTGYSLRIPGYRLAGKTGTAEKIGEIDPISKKPIKGYVANFIGFVPAERPQAVVLVMVNNPKGKYYGGAVAGPVFRDIALSIIREMRIPPRQATAPVEGSSA